VPASAVPMTRTSLSPKRLSDHALGHTWLYRNYAVDDAFITFRFIQQWLAGNGLVFNVGERVEGYSNFLWLATLAPLRLLGLELLSAARLVGLLCDLVTIYLVARLTRETRWPIAASLLLVSLAPFCAWSMGGWRRRSLPCC